MHVYMAIYAVEWKLIFHNDKFSSVISKVVEISKINFSFDLLFMPPWDTLRV